MEEYPDIAKDFNRVINNSDIPEADDFTPYVLGYTYVDMEISLTRDR